MHKMLVLTAALALAAGSGCCLCRNQNACYSPAPVGCDECNSGEMISGPEVYAPGSYGPAPMTLVPGPG